MLASAAVFELIEGAGADALTECAFGNHLPFVLTLKPPPQTHVTKRLFIPQDWTQLDFDKQASHSAHMSNCLSVIC